MSAFNVINDIAVSPWNNQFVLKDPSPKLAGGPDDPCLVMAVSTCKSWSPDRGEVNHCIQAVVASTRQHGAPLAVMYQVSNDSSRLCSLHPSMEAAKAAVLGDLYSLHFSERQREAVGLCEQAVARSVNDLVADCRLG